MDADDDDVKRTRLRTLWDLLAQLLERLPDLAAAANRVHTECDHAVARSRAMQEMQHATIH